MLVRNATYIWAGTVRLNARYFISWYERSKVEEIAVARGKRWVEKLRRTEQKGMVYCLSKAQCERMAEELDSFYYHAEVEDRAERL